MFLSLLLGMLVSCDNQAKPPSKALLGVSAQSELWWISLTREPDAKIGPIKDSSGRSVSGVYDLAWNGATSFAWAVGDHGYTLYRVEVSTGVATRVGALGTFVNGLTLGPTGVLIGAGYGRLYDIDATTGVATPISDLTLPCDSSGDLAYLNGYLVRHHEVLGCLQRLLNRSGPQRENCQDRWQHRLLQRVWPLYLGRWALWNDWVRGTHPHRPLFRERNPAPNLELRRLRNTVATLSPWLVLGACRASYLGPPGWPPGSGGAPGGGGGGLPGAQAGLGLLRKL